MANQTRPWDAAEHPKTKEDIALYLEAAFEGGAAGALPGHYPRRFPKIPHFQPLGFVIKVVRTSPSWYFLLTQCDTITIRGCFFTLRP